jgi:dipeptidyl aminopeptidase/acylaminoacyl peptidase
VSRRLLYFIFTGVLHAGPSCLGPELVWNLKSVTDPQISPDGKSVVYVQSWNDPRDDIAYSNLWLNDRRLTEGNHRDSSPRWAPDGKRLAYISDRGGATRLWVRTLATGNKKPVTATNQTPSHIEWSPDGKWIAFLAFLPGKPAWNPPIPAPPPGAKWAPPAVALTDLRWTFDGQGILKPGAMRIFVVPAEGGPPLQISRDPYQHTSYFTDPELIWSRDSRAVLSPAVKAADGWAVYSGNQIYAFPIDGGGPRQLTHGEGHRSALRASPDGKWVAYSGFAWKGQSYHVSHLEMVPAEGGESRVLTPSLDRDVASPIWSSDSRRIYFLSEDHGAINLYEAGLDGSPKQLTHGFQRLGSVSTAAEQAAALRSVSDRPGTIVRFNLSAPDSLQTIADPNREWLSSCPPSAAEEVRYSSFDGREIQGWILKPPGFAVKTKYPLVVSMHGGPHAAYGSTFTHDLQMFAKRGYVVLYTNPRGSTGYGEEFGNMIQYQWPGDDIKDVLAGVDHIVQAGYVDARRMAVIGGSGGGLMTAWMIGHTDRFRAAVALYPVTNWITHVGSDDNGVLIAGVYRKGWPWENPQDYIQRSPLFYARDIKTPTMIITGEEDWRTPIAQSQEFFRALKVRGVDTVFVRVPGESHGIPKHPSHRVAVDCPHFGVAGPVYPLRELTIRAGIGNSG